MLRIASRDALIRHVGARLTLRGAVLEGVDASALDLSRVDLGGAKLTRVLLRGARLAGADLHEAELHDCDLSGANLEAADLSGDQLGGERERSLARAPELQDVQTQVIGFGDGGQRSTFAQRRDVAGCCYGTEHPLRV